MVRRDCAVSGGVGQGSSPIRALDPSRACGSSMDPALELHPGLHRSACVRDIPAPTNPWHRNPSVNEMLRDTMFV